MELFTGKYTCKMDAKNRLVLPARIKSILPENGGNKIYLRAGNDPYVLIYPPDVYEEVVQEALKKLARHGKDNHRYRRAFFGGIVDVELDSMGRFLVPKPTVEHARLKGEVLIVGVGDWFEMWNPHIFNQYVPSPAELDALEEEIFIEKKSNVPMYLSSPGYAQGER
jgi:MraZ protein